MASINQNWKFCPKILLVPFSLIWRYLLEKLTNLFHFYKRGEGEVGRRKAINIIYLLHNYQTDWTKTKPRSTSKQWKYAHHQTDCNKTRTRTFIRSCVAYTVNWKLEILFPKIAFFQISIFFKNWKFFFQKMEKNLWGQKKLNFPQYGIHSVVYHMFIYTI